MTKLFPTVGRRRALPIAAVCAVLALAAGLFAAGNAGASVPTVSISSQVCNEATDGVIVTLGADKSWWNFDITTDRPGLNISTDTASKTLNFEVPRSQVPLTITVRYHQDTYNSKTLLVNAPSCVTPPPPETETTTTTLVTPPTTAVTSPTTEAPATTVPSGVTTPPTTAPVEVESKTTTKPTPSSGAVPVKVANISYAG